MADKRFSLVFDAKMEVGQVREAIKEIDKSLKSSSLKIPQSMSSSLSRMIQSLNNEISNLDSMTGIELDPKKAKGVNQSYEKIFSTYQRIKTVLNEISRMAGIEPEKFFPADATAKINSALKALAAYKKELSAGIKTDAYSQVVKDLKEAEEAERRLQRKKESAKLDKNTAEAEKQSAQKRQAEAEDARKLAKAEAEKTKAEKANIEKRVEAQKRLVEIEKELAKKRSNHQKTIDELAVKTQEKNDRERLGSDIPNRGTDTGEYEKIVQAYERYIQKAEQLQQEINLLEQEKQQLGQLQPASQEDLDKAATQAEEASTRYENAKRKVINATKEIETQTKKSESADTQIGIIDQELSTVEQKIQSLAMQKKGLELIFERSTFDNLVGELKKLGIVLPDTERSVDGVENRIKELKLAAEGGVIIALNNMGEAAENADEELNNLSNKNTPFRGWTEEMSYAQRDMENLKNQVLNFFSMTNTVQIFKRTIRSAFNTVKELDAAMTETAVVTDFSIGNMWDKLPEYSNQATKLGTSIKSLYEATTLYYQQGLNSQQAMGVGIETMKMARIANMDAAAATEAMTAALRGFNMEINEMSATRINDVYSELAAITAADTSQIATAMSKTASIAASANMEFETTAALLAQIIETTQEAPETAGTAMKTIIARFTEVKQLFSKGMLTGEDEEGEKININKIDAALKSVGISLKDFLNGSKGIDDIFLELASKWDTLDLATQRYIATTAAGSRQQSRFLAMMSNYDRTMELVGAATDSAGASQKQFDKTLESLDAKLQRLRNAWAEFTMGLANSDVIKFAVDFLTDFIEIVNKLTGIAGNDGLGGIITMFSRLGIVIGSLKGGGAIIHKLIEGVYPGGKGGKFLKQNKQTNGIEAVTEGVKNLPNLFANAKGGATSFLGTIGKFGGYALAIAAVAIAINYVVKSFKAAQKSAKLGNLEASLNSVNEQAQKTQTTLSEIGEDRTNLKAIEQELNELTKGTENWRQKLISVNSEVLNLIEKYGELSDNIEIGDNGQLTITNEGWEELTKNQQQIAQNLISQRIAIQASIKDLQSSMEADNFIIQTQKNSLEQSGEYFSEFNNWLGKLDSFGILTDFGKEIDSFSQDILNFSSKSLLSLGSWLDSEISILGHDFGITFGEGISKYLDYSKFFTPSGMGFSSKVLNKTADEHGGYRNLFERSMSGGLTDTELSKFAAALANNNIYISDGLSTDELKNAEEIFNNMNFNFSSFNETINKISAMGQEFDLLAQATLNLRNQEQQLARGFVNNAVSSSKVIGQTELTDSISNLINLTKGYDQDFSTDTLDAKIAELKKSFEDGQYKDQNLQTKTLEQRYADIQGYAVSGGKIYTDATYTQEVEASEEIMLRAIASADLTLQIQTEADEFFNILSGKNKNLFDELFSYEGQGISANQINKYQQENGIDFSQIEKDLHMSLEEIANELGVDTAKVQEILTQNLIMATERIAKQRANLTKRMTKYAIGKDDTFAENANDLAGLEEKFGEQIRYTLEGVLNSLERTESFDITSQGLDYFKNVALSGTQEEVEQLTNFIEQVDWSDPIKAVYKLNMEIEKGSELTKGFAKTISEVDSEFLGTGSQFQAFFASDEYSEIEEKLEEIYDAQGKIINSDIRKLSSEYNYLNKLLKNTSVTADGLANILTGIREGTLGFEDLTDVVIEAIGGMNQLDDATNKVLERLRNIDLGEDLGEVQDTYTNWAEKIKEFQEEGQYGNPQHKAILEQIYGKGFEGNRAGQELIDWYQTLGDQVEQLYGKDMFYGWEQAAKGMNIYGKAIEDQSSKLAELGIQLEMINGEVVFNVPDDKTFDWTAEQLSAIIGGTKEHWEAMLTYFANRTPEMWRTWDLADYNQIGARSAEKATEIKEQKFVTSKEVNDIVTRVSIEYPEKDPETILNDIQNQFKDNNVKIITLLNTEDINEQANNIISQLNSSFGNAEFSFVNKFTKTLEDGILSLDFTGMMSAINSLPIPEEIATQVSNSLAKSVSDLGGQITYEVEGETRILDLALVVNGTEFVEAVNAQTAQAEEQVNNAELDSTATVTIDQAAWNASVAAAKRYIDGIMSRLSYSASVTASTGEDTSNTSSTDSKPKLASGTKNHPRSEPALTGEEGPELVETEEGAYLTGTEGPQMAYINRGDTVYTAEETKEIYKRKGKTIPAYKGGAIGAVSSSGGKGSGNSDNDDDKWENPFDKLYNLVRKIDEELRQRERIERRYEKLLQGINSSANKIIQISREELAQLEKERMLQEQLVSGRRSQIEQYQRENSDLMRYANVVQNDRGEDVLRINWDLINSVTDSDQGQRIEDYVNQLEEWFDELTQAEDALWDIEDAVAEIKERGKEEYFNLEDKIKEALTQAYQSEIDKLNEINTSINDTNSSLVDAIQKSIDKSRQDRDNQRTEEDLAEKQRRLLYLQQDTSGANAMEILKLQEEIAQGQEDYTDTLIDQKISELQEQNEQASQQREQQITLMQSQLDQYVNSGKIWQEVYGLMDEGLDQENGLIRGSRLEEILKNSDNFKGLSAIGQQEWWNDMQKMIAQALAYLEVGRQLEDIGVAAGTQIDFTTSDGRTLSGTVNEHGDVVTADGQVYNNVFQGADGRYYAGENIDDVEEPEVEGPSGGQGGGEESKPQPKNNPYGVASNQGNYTARNGTMWSSGVKAIQWALNDMGYNTGTIDGGYGYATAQAVSRFQRAEGISADGDYGPQTREKMKLRGYKTGGLADFTGPAWLDGTKAHPELVLNQRDTQNFIQLKDILASLMSGGSHTSTENNGDITYDIDINVESIGSDYDVEQVANKVRSLINSDARYRNNNAVSLMR